MSKKREEISKGADCAYLVVGLFLCSLMWVFFISSWFFLSLGGKQTKKNPELKLNERWMKSTQDESIVVYGQQFDVGIYLLFSCSSFFFSFLPSIMNELDLLSLITISWWIFSHLPLLYSLVVCVSCRITGIIVGLMQGLPKNLDVEEEV